MFLIKLVNSHTNPVFEEESRIAFSPSTLYTLQQASGGSSHSTLKATKALKETLLAKIRKQQT